MGVAAGLVAATVLLGTLSAEAQQRDTVAAEALFRAGRDLARSGDYVGACPKFAESYELDPSLGTLLNLADCREKTGRVASAWSHFQTLAQNLPANDERQKYARERIAALEPRLPKIMIKLAATAPKDAKIKRDGLAVGRGSLGFPVPVDPGDHEVVVSAPGREDKSYTVTVKESETKELEVDVGAALPEEPEPVVGPKPAGGGTTTTTPAVVDRGTEPDRTAAWVALGMGGAGIIVGGVFGVLALDKKSELEDFGCANDDVCEKDTSTNGQDSKDASDAGKRYAAISTIGFAVGAVGLGVGTYLLLSSSSSGETRAGLVSDGAGARFVLRRSF